MDVHYSTPPPQLSPQNPLQARIQGEINRDGCDRTSSPSPAIPQASSVNHGPQACQRCRQHKLRCSHEFPNCSRCKRASASCFYPPPPDRKLLATQRVRKTKFRPSQKMKASDGRCIITEQSSEVIGPEESRSPAIEEQSGRIIEFDIRRGDDPQDHIPGSEPANLTLYSSQGNSVLNSIPTPSLEVARLLIEMYFTRVYNATLLFHKETFLEDYSANRLPDFIIHAIFALASMWGLLLCCKFVRRTKPNRFLPVPSKDSRRDDHDNELGISNLSTSDFRIFAHEWATKSTQQVLIQAINPSIESIRACQVLSLYWFSKEDRNQAHTLTHLAYTACRLMGFHVRMGEILTHDEQFAELKRRCLWSCWMTACISQENAPFKNESWSEVVGIPLPADEVSFASGKPELVETFDKNGNVVRYNESNKIRRTSVMGELVKLFALWWEIQRFVKAHQDEASSDPVNKLQGFLKLDRRLERFSDALHPDFKYSGPSTFVSTKLDPYALFSLQCLYRLCACALHSSFVPLFSSTSPDPEIPRKIIRMCAEEAVRHSIITLDMAASFLKTRPDKSRLSSMTGYAMFVTSAVQIRSLGAQGKLKTHAGHLKAAVTILRHLNEYWKPLRSLWIKLVVMSSFAGLDLDRFAASREDQQTSQVLIQTNFDQIISPEAVSESSPRTDLYTYVERREPGALTPQLPAANSSSHGAIEQTFPPVRDGNDTGVAKQNAYAHRLADEQRINTGELLQAGSIRDISCFSPLTPSSNQTARQSQSNRGYNNGLGNYNNLHLSATDFNFGENNLSSQLHSSSMNRHAMLSERTESFRPMTDDFDSANGIMGLGMDLDLGDEENDFWWTRSWGSVRIL